MNNELDLKMESYFDRIYTEFLRPNEFETVILESPYAPSENYSVEDNVAYAKACVRHCLNKGESAYGSHLYFTLPGLLDDRIPEERRKGIQAGFAWRGATEKTVVYLDHGLSNGMIEGIFHALVHKKTLEFRSLYQDLVLPYRISSCVYIKDMQDTVINIYQSRMTGMHQYDESVISDNLSVEYGKILLIGDPSQCEVYLLEPLPKGEPHKSLRDKIWKDNVSCFFSESKV